MRVNVKKAFQYYIGINNLYIMSYADVAKEFGVCLRTVEYWGSKNNWFHRRKNINDSKIKAYFNKIDSRYEKAMKAPNCGKVAQFIG